MKEGYPTKRPTKWTKFYADKLDLNERKKSFDFESCGSAALSLITGISVKTVEKSCPEPLTGWYTTNMIKYLRKKGYKVIEMSKNRILSSDYYLPRLHKAHCILINAHTDMQENSAYVLHAGEIWHNFIKIENPGPLFFLNIPTQDVLLVWHPKWGSGINYGNWASAC